MSIRSFPHGTYLLYDDDCGICTLFSHWFGRLLGERTTVLPMHLNQVHEEGMAQIPEEYWNSFHIVQNGQWYTEGEAMIQLAGIFPMGKSLQWVARFPPIYRFLTYFLRQMQLRRKTECKVDMS